MAPENLGMIRGELLGALDDIDKQLMDLDVTTMICLIYYDILWIDGWSLCRLWRYTLTLLPGLQSRPASQRGIGGYRVPGAVLSHDLSFL
jgi:hypothetical protein